jgi:hypothetical protein
MKNSTSFETCKHGRPSELVCIQFIRHPHLYGLEAGKAIRLLETIEASHKSPEVRQNASLLLLGIKCGREIFDEYPLVSERGKEKQSPPIYIHDVILSEISNAIKAGLSRNRRLQ